MGYIRSNLAPKEKVERWANFHLFSWLFALLVSIFIVGIFGLIPMLCTERAITNKRVIVKTGVIARRTEEINLGKIEEVNVRQSMLGRVLGYGTVYINGTGGSSLELRSIAWPNRFRRVLQRVMYDS